METLKKYLFLLLGIALVIWSFYAFLNSPAPAHYQPRVDSRVEAGQNISQLFIGGIQIPIEIAESNEERAQGLSGRAALPSGQGLLFIFDLPGSYGFWMKDMQFPIDIVWINENWEVIGLERRVTPETYPTTFYPPSPVKYVLELNSGDATRLGIDIGSKLFFTR